jgi:hypothetical protein
MTFPINHSHNYLSGQMFSKPEAKTQYSNTPVFQYSNWGDPSSAVALLRRVEAPKFFQDTIEI